MPHPSHDILSCYADGELEAHRAADVLAHLRDCTECSDRLAEIRAMAQQIAAIDPNFSQIAMERLRRRMRQVAQERLTHTEWILSAVAASVLLVGSFWLTRLREQPEAAPPWVEASVASDSSSREVNTNPAAVWYLSSATGRGDELP